MIRKVVKSSCVAGEVLTASHEVAGRVCPQRPRSCHLCFADPHHNGRLLSVVNVIYT